MISLHARHNPFDGRPGSMKGLIFNIQRFSLHDGPGIRSTVFLKGCPLNCKWCSNPESIASTPEIISYPIKCVGCGKCVEICPQHAIDLRNGKSVIDWEKCNKCLKCAGVCLTGGITLVGKEMSVQEVVSEVERDAPFYINSGGGVTFSGGEPLRQWKFVTEACKECKEKGIHTALDTSGYTDWEKMEEAMQYIDLLLYDIKHLDPERHKAWTGADNALILDNALKAVRRVRTWFRIPVIPGFNDSVSLIRRIVELAKRTGVERVSLLPYHRWSVSKYAGLGKQYSLGDLKEIPEQQLLELKKSCESNGVEMTLRH